MEVIASRVDQLEKSKIAPVRPVPTPAPSKSKPKKRRTESAYAEWDARKYKGTEEERRRDRENRRLLREERQKATEEELARKIKELQPLGDDENDDDEHETEEQPTQQEKAPEKKTDKETPAARNKRYELERRRKDKAEREAEKAKATKQTVDDELETAKSPAAKKGKSPGRGKRKIDEPDKETPGTSTDKQEIKSPERAAKPKVKSPGRSKRKVKSPGRQPSKNKEKKIDDTTGRTVAAEKAPKPTRKDDDTKSRAVAEEKQTKPTPKTATMKHIDDDDYDLDLNTGKFVKKKKQRATVPEDEDDDLEMEEVDDVDKDLDYDPDKDDDQGDDKEQEIVNLDDDDFDIPPIRAKKQMKGDKSSSHKKHKQASKEATEDLADFVEETFKRSTRQSVRKLKGQDACINPEEAARFQKAMKDEALELEKAVRKGRNVSAAYKTLVTHVIEACKDIKYDIPADLEANDIYPTIQDPECKAWRLKIQGVQTAGEGELNVSKTDNSGIYVAKKKFGLSDVMAYAEEVSEDWSEIKRKNFILTIKKVMGNMTVAHRMVAEASQEMLNLLDEIDLPLSLKLADITMRPLVHLEIPEVTIMCEEAKQVCKANEQSWDQTTKITTIMEGQCLPFLPTAWGYDREGRAKKVVAGIIYKYVKDCMYEGKVETTAKEVSEKFGFNATTMNRHILGKKYAGGKASGSGTARRPAAVKRPAVEQKIKDSASASGSKSSTKRPVEKSTVEDDDEETTKKSKGKGKSSGTRRSAQEIRDESKLQSEKQKAKKRKQEQKQLEAEEDEDRSTEEEIRKSGPPKKYISIS